MTAVKIDFENISSFLENGITNKVGLHIHKEINKSARTIFNR